MEEDKNKTPEMLAKEDSEVAYWLHKKFQSGLESKIIPQKPMPKT